MPILQVLLSRPPRVSTFVPPTYDSTFIQPSIPWWETITSNSMFKMRSKVFLLFLNSKWLRQSASLSLLSPHRQKLLRFSTLYLSWSPSSTNNTVSVELDRIMAGYNQQRSCPSGVWGMASFVLLYIVISRRKMIYHVISWKAFWFMLWKSNLEYCFYRT